MARGRRGTCLARQRGVGQGRQMRLAETWGPRQAARGRLPEPSGAQEGSSGRYGSSRQMALHAGAHRKQEARLCVV